MTGRQSLRGRGISRSADRPGGEPAISTARNPAAHRPPGADRPDRSRDQQGEPVHRPRRAPFPAQHLTSPRVPRTPPGLRLSQAVLRAGGKARRHDRLPLPAEVGEALVACLARGRAAAGTRRLFLTCKAPRGPIRAGVVGDAGGAGLLAGGPATGAPVSRQEPTPPDASGIRHAGVAGLPRHLTTWSSAAGCMRDGRVVSRGKIP